MYISCIDMLSKANQLKVLMWDIFIFMWLDYKALVMLNEYFLGCHARTLYYSVRCGGVYILKEKKMLMDNSSHDDTAAAQVLVSASDR